MSGCLSQQVLNVSRCLVLEKWEEGRIVLGRLRRRQTRHARSQAHARKWWWRAKKEIK